MPLEASTTTISPCGPDGDVGEHDHLLMVVSSIPNELHQPSNTRRTKDNSGDSDTGEPSSCCVDELLEDFSDHEDNDGNGDNDGDKEEEEEANNDDELVIRLEKGELDTSVGAYLRMLRDNGEFRNYFISCSITAASEFVTLIANISMIEEFQGENKKQLYISALILVKTLTGVLTSMFLGGSLADTYDRRKIAIVLNFVSALLALLNFVPLYFRSIPGVLVVVALYQLMYGLYSPASSAILPATAKTPTQIRMATVLTVTTMMGAMSPLGCAIGGIIATEYGVGACFIFDCVSFLLSALFLLFMRGSYLPNGYERSKRLDDPSESRFAKSCRMTREGWAYTRRQFWSGLLMLRWPVGFQAGAMDVLMVSFSETIPGNSSMNLAWLYLTLGLGCFVGPASALSINGEAPRVRDFQTAAVVGLFVTCIGAVGMGVTGAFLNTLVAVCCCNIARASGGKVVSVNARLLQQRFSDDAMLGRVMSLDFAQFWVSVALGAVTGGVLQDVAHFDPTNAAFLISCFLGVITLYWTYYHLDGRGAASPEAAIFDHQSCPPLKTLEDAANDNSEDTRTRKRTPIARKRGAVCALFLAIFLVAVIQLVMTEVLFSMKQDRQENFVSETAEGDELEASASTLGPLSMDAVRLSDFAVAT